MQLMAAEQSAVLLLGVPAEASSLFLLPKAAMGFALLGLLGAAAAWHQKSWSRRARVYDLVTLASAIALSSFWLSYGLL